MALSVTDLLKGLDFTGLGGTATAADHTTLVDSATPVLDSASEGKGFVLWTVDSGVNVPIVPNPTTTSNYNKWKRYIWLRVPNISATSTVPMLYMWNDNAANVATYLRWQRVTADTTTVEALIAATQAEVDLVEVDVATANSTATAANNTASNASIVALSAQTTADIANGNATTALATLNTPTTGVVDRLAAVEAVNATQNSSISGINVTLSNLSITVATVGPVFFTPVTILTTAGGGVAAWTTYNAAAWIPVGAKAAILQVSTAIATGLAVKTLNVRSSSTGATFTPFTAATYAAGQCMVPIIAARTFDYEITDSAPVALGTMTLQLIGYVL